MRRTTLALLLLAGGCSDPAATDSAPPAEAPQGGVDCPTGKCDGVFDTVVDYYDDMRSLKLDDLVGLGIGYADEPLNEALSVVPWVDISLGDTALFGLEEKALFGQVVQQDLTALRQSLTTQLGEKAFATRVTGWREDTLRGTDAQVFAESRFRIKQSINPAWHMSAGDVLGDIGFVASPDLEAVLIAPFADNLEAAWRSPLETLKASRGFVFPRRFADVRKMAPGATLALRGTGTLGFNLGVGLPITVGTIADFVALSARIHAAARVAMTGQLDVQLVRGEGDEAWLDVGMTRHTLKHFELALKTGWGIAGLPEVNLDLGVIDVDLAQIAGDALEKQLNRRLEVLRAGVSRSSDDYRLTVARFRFDLGAESDDITQALAQGMRGDVRLAQALANRPDSGVVQTLDLAKDARSESSYLGFRFLSMHFFTAEDTDVGVIQVDDGETARTLLFSELERRSGFFFVERGLAWRQVTALVSKEGRLVDADVNVRLTLRESDSFFGKDQVLDHVDSMLGWLVGYDPTFITLGPVTDALAEHVDEACPLGGGGPRDSQAERRREQRACLERFTTDSARLQLQSASDDAWAEATKDGYAGDFGPDFMGASEAARRLFDFKKAVSNQRWNDSPKGAMLTQVRFSEAALGSIFGPTDAGERFRGALEEVLTLMEVDRDDDLDDKIDEMTDLVEKGRARAIDRVVQSFNTAAGRWQQLDRVAGLSPFGDTIDDHGHLILVPIADPDAPTLATVAEFKGEVLADLMGDLVDASGSLGEPEGFVIGYALIRLTRPEDVELLTDYHFKDGADDVPDVQLYGRGAQGAFIDAGQFDLDSLIEAR